MTKRNRGYLLGDGERRTTIAALRAMQGDGPLVYAILTGDGLIKIGVTTDIVDRVYRIKGGAAKILALKPGNFADELAIHRSLRGHAAEGREYYHQTPAVLKVVNEMRVPMGLEPIAFKRRFAS